MIPPTTSHPKTPPSWIAAWPNRQQLANMFSNPMRQASSALLLHLTDISVSWTDTQLRVHLGAHTNTWVYTNGVWSRNCTCKAPSGKCVHDYAAVIVLQTIFFREGWTDSLGRVVVKANSTTANNTAFQEAPASPQTSGQTHATHTAFHAVPSVVNQRPMVQQNLPLNAPIVKDEPYRTPVKLEVEVDMKMFSDSIVLRFYRMMNELRELLSIQQFINLNYDVTRQNGPNKWSEEDISFIPWAVRKIRGDHLQFARSIPSQSQFYRMSRTDFHQWQERWNDQPERFIDRESQQFLRPSGLTKPVDMSVELVLDRDFITVVPSYVFQNGKQYTLPKLMDAIANATDKEDVRIALREYKTPFPLAPFLRGTVKIRKDQLRHDLPPLLNNHLELITGRNVVVLNEKTHPVLVKLSSDNGMFVIEAIFEGKPVDMDGHTPIEASVRCVHDKIELRKGRVTSIDTVREAVNRLQPAAFMREGKCYLYETSINAVQLKKFWDALPDTIVKFYEPELAGIFKKSSTPLQLNINASQENAFAHLDLSWSVDDNFSCTTADLSRCARSSQPFFQTSDGKWLSIEPEQAQAVLAKLEQMGFTQLSDTSLLAAHAGEVVKELAQNFHTNLDSDSSCFAKQLSEHPPVELPAIPAHLLNTLRHYQREGVEFLLDRIFCGAGPILADDMGLGKTLQVLSLLETCRDEARRQGRPFHALVICPASVIPVWISQARNFCPTLSLQPIQGTAAQRQNIISNFSADVLVTHYYLMRIDAETIAKQTLDYLILDEAQAIKNPTAQVTQAINSLDTRHVVALTGTPLENSVHDLWSIMNRLNPGFLGTLENFNDRYCHQRDGLGALSRKLSPLILRRSKQLVAPELPPKTEEILQVEMTEEQRAYYTSQLAMGQELLKSQGTGSILGTLTRLRQICCHPDLVAKRDTALGSAKLDLLMEKLLDLQSSGHSSLVFSQFTTMLDKIAQRLTDASIPFRTITGETPVPKRSKLVEEFDKDENPSVFLLSLKAAGTGLTLTKADYVFLYDPWWNPAVERQAIDRTHRIGQDKPVFAYKFVVQDSVEEKVQLLVEHKKELFEEVMDGAIEQSMPSRLTIDDLRSLLD